VAKIWRERSDQGPKCENGVRLEFSEQIDRAFAYSLNRAPTEDLADTCHLAEKKAQARFDEKFSHNRLFKIDAAITPRGQLSVSDSGKRPRYVKSRDLHTPP